MQVACATRRSNPDGHTRLPLWIVAIAAAAVLAATSALSSAVAADGVDESSCRVPEPTAQVEPPRTFASPAEFGVALADAALAQTGDLVIYTDRYRRMSFPAGDVAALFGVCTDVVIRAYRAVGLDLQSLVQHAKVGRGDPNLDHRRTEILRKFFAAHGAELPASDIADDYRPGDIVTYYRPQNFGSPSHIAIVSNRIGISGRPMIVHNRGWGPQLEDALFVDRITGRYRYITGRYRYSGQPRVKPASTGAPSPKLLTKGRNRADP